MKAIWRILFLFYPFLAGAQTITLHGDDSSVTISALRMVKVHPGFLEQEHLIFTIDSIRPNVKSVAIEIQREGKELNDVILLRYDGKRSYELPLIKQLVRKQELKNGNILLFKVLFYGAVSDEYRYMSYWVKII